MIFKTTTSHPVFLQMRREKSRRDGILLTVGFNLRKQSYHIHSKSRRDGILSFHYIVLAGLWKERIVFLVRRLKSTVNKMLSLRDYLPLIQYYYKLFTFSSSS